MNNNEQIQQSFKGSVFDRTLPLHITMTIALTSIIACQDFGEQ